VYSASNIIRIIKKSGKMRWAGRVARRGAEKDVHAVLFEEREGK
jgi:hypothetical protein